MSRMETHGNLCSTWERLNAEKVRGNQRQTYFRKNAASTRKSEGGAKPFREMKFNRAGSNITGA